MDNFTLCVRSRDRITGGAIAAYRVTFPPAVQAPPASAKWKVTTHVMTYATTTTAVLEMQVRASGRCAYTSTCSPFTAAASSNMSDWTTVQIVKPSTTPPAPCPVYFNSIPTEMEVRWWSVTAGAQAADTYVGEHVFLMHWERVE